MLEVVLVVQRVVVLPRVVHVLVVLVVLRMVHGGDNGGIGGEECPCFVTDACW